VGVLSGNGRFAIGKWHLEPALISEKCPARVNEYTFGAITTGQIARNDRITIGKLT